MNGIYVFLIAGAAAAVAYLWFLARLGAVAQPYRLSMAQTGERLLADKNLPASVRDQTEFYLDHAYASWPSLLAVFVFPFIALYMLFVRGDQTFQQDLSRLENGERAAHRKVRELFFWSQFAASPITSFIVLLEVGLFLVLAVFFERPIEEIRKALERAVKVDMNLSKRVAHAHPH